MNKTHWLLPLIPLALAAASTPARAVDLLSTNGTGPVGNCQAALPAYEGMTRKRPLALVNEGEDVSFVTCALTTEEVSLNVNHFSTRVSNLGDEAVTVSCTAVVGDELDSTRYIVKTLTLPPGGEDTLAWGLADNGGLLFNKSIALSCALPPMVGLNRNRVTTLLSIL